MTIDKEIGSRLRFITIDYSTIRLIEVRPTRKSFWLIKLSNMGALRYVLNFIVTCEVVSSFVNEMGSRDLCHLCLHVTRAAQPSTSTRMDDVSTSRASRKRAHMTARVAWPDGNE